MFCISFDNFLCTFYAHFYFLLLGTGLHEWSQPRLLMKGQMPMMDFSASSREIDKFAVTAKSTLLAVIQSCCRASKCFFRVSFERPLENLNRKLESKIRAVQFSAKINRIKNPQSRTKRRCQVAIFRMQLFLMFISMIYLLNISLSYRFSIGVSLLQT